MATTIVIHVLRLWLIISSYRCCPTYKPPLVENMREHSLFRATTQRMLVLPSVLSHNSRNIPTSDPWDIAQSLVDYAHPKKAKHDVCFIKNRMALHTSRQMQKVSRPSGGGHVLLGAKCLWCYCFHKHRLAGHASILYWFCSHPLAVKQHRQAVHQYLHNPGF